MPLSEKPNPTDTIKVNLTVPFSFEDVSKVIERFYREVARDEVLSVPFSSVKDWPHHIDRLTHFWWVLFGGERYRPDIYDPVTKHVRAGFNQVFLARWLSLFHEVLDQVLKPEQAEIWKAMSERMGVGLSMKNDQYLRAMSSGM